jgi:hypothetical protein
VLTLPYDLNFARRCSRRRGSLPNSLTRIVFAAGETSEYVSESLGMGLSLGRLTVQNGRVVQQELIGVHELVGLIEGRNGVIG